MNTIARIYRGILASLLTIVPFIRCAPLPIGFSISAHKIVEEIPEKDQDFAFIIPGKIDTYIYKEESHYYQDYQRSYFAVTNVKGGWDCMRHYEILANGCIPYFLDLDKCNSKVMHLLPKALIKEAMNLEGVSYLKIDHTKFNKKRYYEILTKLLEHTRRYLTTKHMAAYMLRQVDYNENGPILFLTTKVEPDYMPDCILAGLKELYQERVIDVPKIDFLYKSYKGDVKTLYGRGMSYTKLVDDLPIDRENIEQRIRNKEFDLIIYGSVHRGLPYHNLIKQMYESERIIYICGEDCHQCEYKNLPSLFLREFDIRSPLTWPFYREVK